MTFAGKFVYMAHHFILLRLRPFDLRVDSDRSEDGVDIYIYSNFYAFFFEMSQNINSTTRHLKFCYILIFYKSSTD